MDLVATMIRDHLVRNHTGEVEVTSLVPTYQYRAAHLPGVGDKGLARNLDRIINRFWDYPRALKTDVRRDAFDLFHLADHSYSQLLHALPAGRVVITCHDLDTFRCLLEPAAEPRPRWFRSMTERILSGFRKAAAVSCDSEATRLAILKYDLLPEDTLKTIPLGIAPEFSHEAHPVADAEATRLLGPVGPVELLHVGSTIPRKRIDVLLEVVAAIRRQTPDVRLIRVGGPLTSEQEASADRLGLRESLTPLPFLSRETLAAIYRRSALVLQPSDAEGFGLPVAEALACGAVVVSSDLAVLREVGGSAATYCPVAQPEIWAATILNLLERRTQQPEAWRGRRLIGVEHARQFSWDRHAEQLMTLYKQIRLEGR